MGVKTILDCIQDIPRLSQKIIDNRKQRFAVAIEALVEQNQSEQFNEIILIGSGTSDTAAQTARKFMETTTGIRTTTICPNEFVQNYQRYDSKTIYLFVSQTGSSIMTGEVVEMVQSQSCFTIGITESATTLLAQKVHEHIEMGCEDEIYPTRTIGYSTTVVTLMVFALELASKLGKISEASYQAQLVDLSQTIASCEALPGQVMTWLDGHRRKFMQSNCLLFIASSDLLGVAREAAMKVWELPQVAAIGYEIEESLHGPNYGYNNNHCVVVLNDGGENQPKMLALAKYTKDIYRNGYVIGAKGVDQTDFELALGAEPFKWLPFATVIQVLAYRLALDGGRDLLSPHDNSVMYSYFKTHAE